MEPAGLRDALVVSLSRTYWDDVWRSRHQVMTRLSRTNDVLFVSRARPRGDSAGRPGLQVVSGRLRTYEPPRWLPYVGTRPWLERRFDRMRCRLLRKLVDREKPRDVILYLWDPAFVSYLDAFPEALVCYHLFDELTLYGGRSDRSRLDDLTRVLARADVVIAASKPLAEKYGRGRPVHLCPNGVDTEIFRPRSSVSGGELAKVPQPRLVFAGSLRPQIDVDVLDAIAEARPTWSLVFVGDVAKSVRGVPATERLLARENVHALGRRSQSDVAEILAECDVALAPYCDDRAALFCSPLKIPEYLAVGLPVVASPLAGATVFGDSVHYARKADEWLAAIDSALGEGDAASRATRRALAMSFSWDVRVAEIGEWLVSAQMKRRQGL